MAFSMAAEIERDLISARTKEAPGARKASGQPLGRPKGPGKSKLDPFRPEIEALQHNARKLLKLDEEERNQETQRIEILWRNRYLCWVRAYFVKRHKSSDLFSVCSSRCPYMQLRSV